MNTTEHTGRHGQLEVDLEKGDSQISTQRVQFDLSDSSASSTRRDDTLFGSFSSTASTMAPSEYSMDLAIAKYPSKWMRKLRWSLFSVYRRLNIFVLLVNASVIAAFGARHQLWSMSVEQMSTAVAANIACSVLMRNEIVANVLFAVFGCTPQWLPLRIRRLAAKIYHLGGVHSGAGMAAFLWFIVLNAAIIQKQIKQEFAGFGIALLTITAVIDILFLVIILLSHPTFRAKHHNTWECSHRFGGWAAVALFWVHLCLFVAAEHKTNPAHPAMRALLVKSPTLWLLVLITICLIWPWLHLRKVDVYAEKLSDHATRLHFTHEDIAFCAAPRFSDAPLREWHSFAGIPGENGKGYSVLVSKAGDWTRALIKDPPRKLWTRSIPIRGVLHIAPIFKSMVLVATGSGIGPVLSLLYAAKVNCRILWSTPHSEMTYQAGILRKVLEADPNAVIINTKKAARPDLSAEAYRLYQEHGAEAVFVISNPGTCRVVTFNLESHGVPCFSPIFDS